MVESYLREERYWLELRMLSSDRRIELHFRLKAGSQNPKQPKMEPCLLEERRLGTTRLRFSTFAGLFRCMFR